MYYQQHYKTIISTKDNRVKKQRILSKNSGGLMTDCDELLARCAQRDAVAFQKLYEQTSSRMYALCLRMLKHEGLAEDVLQEAYVKIWDNAHRFMPTKGKAMTWMTTVVRNKTLDKLRSLKSRPVETEAVYEGIEFASENLEPDQFSSLSEDTAKLMECLDCLKPEQKECILMSYYYGHTHEEMSRELERPLGTVKAWIRRGLERLRLCLK